MTVFWLRVLLAEIASFPHPPGSFARQRSQLELLPLSSLEYNDIQCYTHLYRRAVS